MERADAARAVLMGFAKDTAIVLSAVGLAYGALVELHEAGRIGYIGMKTVNAPSRRDISICSELEGKGHRTWEEEVVMIVRASADRSEDNKMIEKLRRAAKRIEAGKRAEYDAFYDYLRRTDPQNRDADECATSLAAALDHNPQRRFVVLRPGYKQRSDDKSIFAPMDEARKVPAPAVRENIAQRKI